MYFLGKKVDVLLIVPFSTKWIQAAPIKLHLAINSAPDVYIVCRHFFFF